MLGVEMHTTIKTLFEKGHSKSGIAKMLKIDRKTVAKVLKELEDKGYVERKQYPSILDDYKEYINIQSTKGLSAKRIHQDLRDELGFTGSYDTVKKYISSIKKNSKIYMVLTSLPGEEAQVDFGYIGMIKNTSGKYQKAWIFVMELSYSRYMYACIVFDQKVTTFIDCHKKAFKYFGGVPESVKIDNLKAGILEADFYEATVQRNYAAFANHYRFMPVPCRVYTPTDKGKVESNVKYIKNNCFKGREFKDIYDAQNFLVDWLDTIANVRKHGTTKNIPYEIYINKEKSELQSLPTEEFNIIDISKSNVHTNCHISYRGNYYSVPYNYIGECVDILATDNILKVYYKGEEIALHPLEKKEKGKHITNKNHYPKYKNITSSDIKSSYREKMSKIGEAAVKFFDMYIESVGGKYNYRAIAGILALQKKYDNKIINQACLRAYSYGALRYKTVKQICEKGLSTLPVKTNETYISSQKTNVSRALSEYAKLLN